MGTLDQATTVGETTATVSEFHETDTGLAMGVGFGVAVADRVGVGVGVALMWRGWTEKFASKLDSKGNLIPFTTHDQETMRTFVMFAGIAISNSKLLAGIKRVLPTTPTVRRREARSALASALPLRPATASWRSRRPTGRTT